MKKHWQIKPWVFITIVVVLAGTLLYGFSPSTLDGNYGESYEEAYDMGIQKIAMHESAPSRIMEDSDNSSNFGTTERMMIKSGRLSMVVEDVRDTATSVIEYAEKNGGFLVSSDINESGIDVYGRIQIRIPSELFTESIEEIKALGDTESEYIYGEDITEEYTDLGAKLKNLQAAEEQFLEIMENAYKIEDVLAVQKELTYVREDIEIIEGRMKYLSESVDLSSLTINLSTDPSNLPVVDKEDQWKPVAVFKDAVRSLLGFGQTVVNGIIWLGVYLPVVIVLGLIAWGVKRHKNRKKKK